MRRNILIKLLFVLFMQPLMLWAQSSTNPTAEAASGSSVIPQVRIGTARLNLMGYAQTAYTYTDVADKQTNTFDITRFIFMADAQINDRISFWLMYDFANSKMHEYYAQYAFNKYAKIRVGQFKQPFTLESLLPPFLVSNVGMDDCVKYLAGIATDPCYGNQVGRDAGIMLTGDAWERDGRNLLNYSLGVFNGVGMNQKDNNTQKDVIGMLNYMPVASLKLTTSFILGTARALAANPWDAFKVGEDYKRNRWSAGLEWRGRPAYIRAEYLQGYDGGIHSQGGYALAEIHLCKGLDLLANYDYLRRNNDLRDTETHNVMGGLQYWLYKQCAIRTQCVKKMPHKGSDTFQWVTQFQVVF